MKFHVYMQYEDDSGWYVVTCPALPGCVSQGRTKKEAVNNIKEAILGWLEVEDEKAMSVARDKGMRDMELRVAI